MRLCISRTPNHRCLIAERLSVQVVGFLTDPLSVFTDAQKKPNIYRPNDNATR